jgi:hypothetical protein
MIVSLTSIDVTSSGSPTAEGRRILIRWNYYCSSLNSRCHEAAGAGWLRPWISVHGNLEARDSVLDRLRAGLV